MPTLPDTYLFVIGAVLYGIFMLGSYLEFRKMVRRGDERRGERE